MLEFSNRENHVHFTGEPIGTGLDASSVCNVIEINIKDRELLLLLFSSVNFSFGGSCQVSTPKNPSR